MHGKRLFDKVHAFIYNAMRCNHIAGIPLHEQDFNISFSFSPVLLESVA